MRSPVRDPRCNRRGEAEIAELVAQVVQIACRIAQRIDRVERIGKARKICRLRHELRNALGAFVAHGARVETALLPDHASQKLDRQLVLRRGILQRAADIVGSRWLWRVFSAGLSAVAGWLGAADELCSGGELVPG